MSMTLNPRIANFELFCDFWFDSPSTCRLCLTTAMSKCRAIPPVGAFHGCVVTRVREWSWDLIHLWNDFWLHEPPHKQIFKFMKNERLACIFEMLFPFSPRPVASIDESVGTVLSAQTPAGMDVQVDGSSTLAVKCSTQVLFAVLYWAIFKHRFVARGKQRELCNRMSAAKAVRDFLNFALARIPGTWPLTLRVAGSTQQVWVVNGIVDLRPFFARATLPHEDRDVQRMKCSWEFRGHDLAWVTSTYDRPLLGDLIVLVALLSDFPRHTFWMEQSHLILGQLANIIETHLATIAVDDLQLCKSLLAEKRKRPKQFNCGLLQMVLSSNKKSVPDVLREFRFDDKSIGSMAQLLYKETMQRYLMRLRVDFLTARVLTMCSDKSKVAAGIPNNRVRDVACSIHRFKSSRDRVCLELRKVGRFPTTLCYIYQLDRNIGAMLPPQACLWMEQLVDPCYGQHAIQFVPFIAGETSAVAEQKRHPKQSGLARHLVFIRVVAGTASSV